jgi:hypothetical protein
MATMSFEEIFLGFLIALAAGSLIGLEREQSRIVDRNSAPPIQVTAARMCSQTKNIIVRGARSFQSSVSLGSASGRLLMADR